MLSKILIIVLILIILLMMPFFISWLSKDSVYKKQVEIMELAKKKSKPVIVFHDRYNGKVLNNETEEFNGDIFDIINEMADDSCTIVLIGVLEYVDTVNDVDMGKFIDKLKIVSGGDLYVIGVDKNSARVLWDYKIRNVMSKDIYVPGDIIEWYGVNNIQGTIQKIYGLIFRIVPYDYVKKLKL